MIVVKDFLRENHFLSDKKILIAVSGGVDSMVLLQLFYFYQQRTADSGHHFSVAHINYKLRGEDSDLDQKLVQDFCEKYHIQYYVYEVSEEDNKPVNGSIQLWARELRYRFFREIMERERLDFVATAHHLEDQLETFIINLTRGTGIKGLCGITTNENAVLRPLLGYSKQEIYDFAHQYNVPYREDMSNQKQDYLRNKIRHNITPILKEIQLNFLSNFQKTIGFLEETKDFLEDKINEVFREISSEKKGKILLDKKKLQAEKNIVSFEIFRKFGFENRTEIEKMFTANVGSAFYSEHFQMQVDREFFIISELGFGEENPAEIILDEKNIECTQEGGLILKIPYFQEVSASIFLDLDTLKFPLKLRKTKVGDVFFPIGMQGKKKVSKYFKDEKYSVLEKEETCILADAEENIIWIIPNRQDRRFCATEKTQKMLKVMLIEK